DPPAGHGVRLGEAVDDDGLIIKAGRGDEAGRVPLNAGDRCWEITKAAIDFVADEGDVALGGQFCECFYNGRRGDNAGGIGGAVEEDDFGFAGDGGADFVDIDLEIRVRVNKYGCAGQKFDQRIVHDKVRIEDDDFVARIDQRHHGQN